MRTTPRPRHHINPVAFALLRPALRFSYTREAYVLRVVGNHRGPVFVRTRAAGQGAPAEHGASPEPAGVAEGPSTDRPAIDGRPERADPQGPTARQAPEAGRQQARAD